MRRDHKSGGFVITVIWNGLVKIHTNLSCFTAILDIVVILLKIMSKEITRVRYYGIMKVPYMKKRLLF